MTVSSLLYAFNHSRIWATNLQVWGGQFQAPSLDRYIYLWLHRFGMMGKMDRQVMATLVKPGMRIVDVGANIGLYTFLLSCLTGQQGSVIAFEPEPNLFKALQINCAANSLHMTKHFEYALGQTNASIPFRRSSLNSGDNRIENAKGTENGLEVKLARLDDLLDDHRVDFIKVDVQGHELGVFKGMQKILSTNPDLIIYFEFCPSSLRKADSDGLELLEYLKSFGFRIHQMEGAGLKQVIDFQTLIGSLTGNMFTNLIASQKSF